MIVSAQEQAAGAPLNSASTPGTPSNPGLAASSGPATSQVSPPTEPLVVSQPQADIGEDSGPKFNIKLLLIIFGIFGLLALLAIGFFIGDREYKKAKKEVKNIAQTQIETMAGLGVTFQKIVETLNEESSLYKSSQGNKLLGAKTEKGQVLSAEDDPSIKLQRQLIEIYKQGQNQADILTKNSQQMEEKRIAFPFGPFLPDPGSLTDKTKRYAEETKAMFTFLEKEGSLSIEIFLKSYSVGNTLAMAIYTAGDQMSLQALTDKVNELDQLIREYSALEVEAIPEDLKQEYFDSLKTSNKDLAIIKDLVSALRNHDLDSLKKNLGSLAIGSAAEGDNAVSKTISFWQTSQSVKSLGNLKDDWNGYLSKL
jgi:uncharacterized protein YneF (UPF0154 family)